MLFSHCPNPKYINSSASKQKNGLWNRVVMPRCMYPLNVRVQEAIGVPKWPYRLPDTHFFLPGRFREGRFTGAETAARFSS